MVKVIPFILALLGISTVSLNQDQPNNLIQPQANEETAIIAESSLLPDLTTSPPEELYITVENGNRKLRFSTTLKNTGKGPLHLTHVPNAEQQQTRASQTIQQKEGEPIQREVGKFVFHPDHDHWHIENMTEFQLWDYDTIGKPAQMLAHTGKMSFCTWDMGRLSEAGEQSPTEQQYPRCTDALQPQGLSVGWFDTYGAELPGQEINIADVPDGRYAIVAIANPERQILESDYDNNRSVAFIEISGETVRIVEEPTIG